MKQQQTGADPPTSFLSLPGELRNRIYELVLVREEHSYEWEEIWRHIYHPKGLTVGLLCASKIIHQEATPVFYGQNRFDFSGALPDHVSSFFYQLGKRNASYIRDVNIDFPDVSFLDGVVSLERDAPNTLEIIRGACDNLITLTASLENTDRVENRLAALDDHNIASEALALVDARFRSFPSVQTIIVEVYEDAPCDHIRKTMESHGWLLRTTERERVESDGSPGSIYCD